MNVRMHVAIMGMATAGLVDHREHNERIRVVDNRKSNLRPATSAQNAQNSRKLTCGATPYKGVTRVTKRPGLFQARIRVGEATKNLGCHRSAERAALAYDEAATRYYGEFAWTNFPREMQA